METKEKVHNFKRIEFTLLILIMIAVVIAGFAWARYLTSKSGSAEADVAKWHFELRNANGQTMQSGTIDFPITRTDNNTSVEEGKIAPGTFGEFQVIIDTTGTEVALTYDLDIQLDMSQCPKNIVFYRAEDAEYTPEYFASIADLENAPATVQTDEFSMTNPTKKRIMVGNDGVIKISRYIPLEEADGVFRETIYWNWPFQTGPIDPETEIAAGDEDDTADANKKLTMNIAVTGMQVNKTINPSPETTLVAGPTFNGILKALADNDLSNITSFEKSQTAPASLENCREISVQGATYPIYAWYDNGVIYYWNKNEDGRDVALVLSSGWNMFNGCTNIESIYTNEFDTSEVTNMTSMFLGCSSLTDLDLSKFNTSKVSSMLYMFANCSSLTSLNLSKFDTSKVTNMNRMFEGCISLISLDVSKFDTSKVTDMGYMFRNCSSLITLDVSKFDTRNVTSMVYMFDGCRSLTSLDVTKFDTSNVTSMGQMFSGCRGLTSLDVTKFDTSKVTSMGYMFSSCISLTNLDVTKFDTSKVTSMPYMFNSCISLTNLDVTKFDTSKVTNMAFMFRECTGLTSVDVTKFDTSNVTRMDGMFYKCSSLTSLDVSKFDTSNVTKMEYMFGECASLTTIYANVFNTDNVTTSTFMFGSGKLKGGNGTTFSGSHVDKEYARIDSPGTPGYFTLKTE